MIDDKNVTVDFATAVDERITTHGVCHVYMGNGVSAEGCTKDHSYLRIQETHFNAKIYLNFVELLVAYCTI